MMENRGTLGRPASGNPVMLCVIGAQMKEDEVKHLFGVA